MNSPRFYAGIGSRDTPPEICELMTRAAQALARQGFILRSGAADGADTAFEAGAPADRKEIYLPWPGFNHHPSALHRISDAALELAARFHPNWARLGRTARLLMARNGYQVLGYELDRPVAFVLCWTPDGCISQDTRSARTGGTGQAIAIADAHNIPVFNLAREAHRTRIVHMLQNPEANKRE